MPACPKPGPRPKRQREGMSPAHLAFVRTLPCCVCGVPAVEAHHLLRTGARGMGMRSPDRHAIPLCNAHHRALHAHGDEAGWLAAHGVDGMALAGRLWGATGDAQRAMEALGMA